MKELLPIAEQAARAAGAVLLERFGGPRSGVGTKSSSTDMVSDADRASEAVVVDALARARPDDGVLGEEGGAAEGTSGITWVIDPLDGTTNFLFGIPQWAVSIAAQRDGVSIAGVVFDPLRDELFAAAQGEGATLNGRDIHTTEQADLSQALIATGFSYLPEERSLAAQMLQGMLHRVRDVRRAGAASLDLAWVACGRLDGYYEAPCHLWDRAAGELLVREAQGEVGVMGGLGPSGPGLIAANAGLFHGLRALVESVHPSRARG